MSVIRLAEFVAPTVKVLAAMVADFWFGAIIGANCPIHFGLFARHWLKVGDTLRLYDPPVVLGSVGGGSHDDEIAQAIVVAHAVDVMNNFTLSEWAPEMVGHHKNVLPDIASFVGIRMTGTPEEYIPGLRRNIAVLRVGVPASHRPAHRYIVPPMK